MEDALKLARIIPIVAFGGIAAGLIVLFLHHRKTRREEFQRIARELGGTVAGSFFRGRCIQVRTLGALQRIAFTETGGEIPRTCLTLFQQTDLDFTLEIVKETAASRIAQKMGLTEDEKAGDPAFDRKYRIKTDSPKNAARFLDSPERKRIVDHLFAEDFDLITIRKREVSFRLAGYSDHDLDAALLKKRLDTLMRFVSGAAMPPEPQKGIPSRSAGNAGRLLAGTGSQ